MSIKKLTILIETFVSLNKCRLQKINQIKQSLRIFIIEIPNTPNLIFATSKLNYK